METVKDFVGSIDDRIWNLDLSQVVSAEYLFQDKEIEFYLQNWFLVILFIIAIYSFVQYRYLTKPREKYQKEVRFVKKYAAKRTLYIVAVGLVFWFFRTQEVKHLSWRFWEGLMFASIIINWIIAFVQIYMYKKSGNVIDNSGENSYQQYLPKKKKKS